MLERKPKKSFIKYLKRGAAIAFVAEAVAFAGSYAVYYKLNRDRDFRFYMHNNYPLVLDYFYKIGEIGGYNTREQDQNSWLESSSRSK